MYIRRKVFSLGEGDIDYDYNIYQQLYSKAFEDGVDYVIEKMFAEDEGSKIKNFLKKHGIEYNSDINGIVVNNNRNGFNGRLEKEVNPATGTIHRLSFEELTKLAELADQGGVGTKPKNIFDRLWNFAGRKTNETAERGNLIKFLEETRNSRNKRNNDLAESNPDWVSPKLSTEYKNGSTITVFEGRGGSKNGSSPEKIAHIVETGKVPTQNKNIILDSLKEEGINDISKSDIWGVNEHNRKVANHIVDSLRTERDFNSLLSNLKITNAKEKEAFKNAVRNTRIGVVGAGTALAGGIGFGIHKLIKNKKENKEKD